MKRICVTPREGWALKEFEEPRGLSRRAADGSIRGAIARHHAFHGARGLLRERLDSG